MDWVEDTDSRVRIVKTVWGMTSRASRRTCTDASVAGTPLVPERPTTNGHVTEHAA